MDEKMNAANPELERWIHSVQEMLKEGLEESVDADTLERYVREILPQLETALREGDQFVTLQYSKGSLVLNLQEG